MRAVRVGLPAVTGVGLVLITAVFLVTSLQGSSISLLDAVRAAVLPGAAAILLLLTASAIARGTRAGYVLGVLVAILATLGGVALVLVELPYLADGGLGGAIGGGIIVIAAVWIVVWLVFGLAMLRGRVSFAPAWQPIDRRFGVLAGSLTAVAVATFVGLGLVAEGGATAAAADEAGRQALVAATTVEARVIDATYGPASDGTQKVQTLTLELSFAAESAYPLAQAPTLCLTDWATAIDPAYKPGAVCWGTNGSPLMLADGFGDLRMPRDERRIRLQLGRGDSPCDFGAGSWEGQVAIVPLGSDAGPAPEVYSIATTFRLEASAAPAASGAAPPVNACIASTVSP